MRKLFECKLAITVHIKMIKLSSNLIVRPLRAASITEIGIGCNLVLIFVDSVPMDDIVSL